ncbi:MAG TPA: ABC transporter permease [Bradyrhizobium sp.]|uniref:ABC transporter permease n=1 Tax=Bradyrhizobium sp. TaxID=376 RepID=UPI002C47B0A4|nr:ABC transporter permease [Bradyrhizobium sp.]HLZ04185.1 ABC transporter permease [Bradyrhizobium sp.]
MTLLIAWRNLVHDRVRLLVTLIGIAFSTILMGLELGMLLNFLHTTSTIVDHANVDLWVTAHGVRSVDLATPLEERRRFQTLSVAGVAAAESYLLQFAFWKKPDGVRETVIIIGVDPHAVMGLPWAIEPGRSVHDALSIPDGVIVDRLYAEKLGIDHIDQLVEINDHRARVTAFTNGIRTFTQSPYVFTSLRTARLLTGRADKDITYVLVRLEKGQNPEAAAAALATRMPDVDVLQPTQFSNKSRTYWLFTTGAGTTLIASSVLALMVGVVIVAQTLYASTMDRLPEYATIRAMGGPRSYLYKIVIKQAVVGGLLGYGVGITLVLTLAYLARHSSAAPQVPWWMAGSIAGITILMCAVASLVSLNKVISIDPVKVFR